VVWIVINDDVVVSPIPTLNVGEIKGSHAEVKSAKPEAAGSTSTEAPYVAWSETALEAAMLPGVVKVESRIATAIGVADPFVVSVDVRSFGVRGLVAIRSARLISLPRLSFLAWGLFARRGLPLRCSLGRAASRTARRNISAADAVAASASVAATSIMLR
jgi:hypothetical protein